MCVCVCVHAKLSCSGRAAAQTDILYVYKYDCLRNSENKQLPGHAEPRLLIPSHPVTTLDVQCLRYTATVILLSSPRGSLRSLTNCLFSRTNTNPPLPRVLHIPARATRVGGGGKWRRGESGKTLQSQND